MIEHLIAYKIEEIEKLIRVIQIKDWVRLGIITEEQWTIIKEDYSSKLYAPSVYIKLPLFLITLIGVQLLVTLFFGMLIMGLNNDLGMRLIFLLVGTGLILVSEYLLIREFKHCNSGVTEAVIYIGAGYLGISITGFGFEIPWLTMFVYTGIIIIAIRYLDLIATAISFLFFYLSLFLLLNEAGGVFTATLPFMGAGASLAILLITNKLFESKYEKIFRYQLTLLKTASLIMIYVSLNYFVVRELSISLLNLQISDSEEIPFAAIFYFCTLFIPVFYLLIGIRKKSLLFIRVASICFLASIATFQVYWFKEHAVLYYSIIGVCMIVCALFLYRLLKNKNTGFVTDRFQYESLKVNSIVELAGNKVSDKNLVNNIGESEIGRW